MGVLFLAMLATPVHAQQGGQGARQPTPEEIQQKKEAEAIDQQYKSTLRRMNQDVTPVRTDPWANMRGPSEGKR
jgi:hypothetical protein